MIVSNVVRLRAGLALGAALAAGLALPGTASAQDMVQGAAQAGLPPGALLVVDGSGQPIGVLMPADGTAASSRAAMPQVVGPDPMAEMMALQDAMMRQVQTQMAGLVQAADHADAGGAAASLVIRSVTTGPDGCSRTVVWRQGQGDAAPKMVLDQVADRCAGGEALRAPQGVRQQAPTAAPALQTIVDTHAPVKPAADRPF